MERLKNHSEFVGVLRLRNRVTSADVVAHYALPHQRASYSHIYKQSQKKPVPHGVGAGSQTAQATVATTPASSSNRLGLAVSKAVGNAVVRNKTKRRFRVAARHHEKVLPQGCDIVLRARPSAATVDFVTLDEEIGKLFFKISQKGTLRYDK